jgi:hypothetical protein
MQKYCGLDTTTNDVNNKNGSTKIKITNISAVAPMIIDYQDQIISCLQSINCLDDNNVTVGLSTVADLNSI